MSELPSAQAPTRRMPPRLVVSTNLTPTNSRPGPVPPPTQLFTPNLLRLIPSTPDRAQKLALGTSTHAHSGRERRPAVIVGLQTPQSHREPQLQSSTHRPLDNRHQRYFSQREQEALPRTRPKSTASTVFELDTDTGSDCDAGSLCSSEEVSILGFDLERELEMLDRENERTEMKDLDSEFELELHSADSGEDDSCSVEEDRYNFGYGYASDRSRRRQNRHHQRQNTGSAVEVASASTLRLTKLSTAALTPTLPPPIQGRKPRAAAAPPIQGFKPPSAFFFPAAEPDSPTSASPSASASASARSSLDFSSYSLAHSPAQSLDLAVPWRLGRGNGEQPVTRFPTPTPAPAPTPVTIKSPINFPVARSSPVSGSIRGAGLSRSVSKSALPVRKPIPMVVKAATPRSAALGRKKLPLLPIDTKPGQISEPVPAFASGKAPVSDQSSGQPALSLQSPSRSCSFVRAEIERLNGGKCAIGTEGEKVNGATPDLTRAMNRSRLAPGPGHGARARSRSRSRHKRISTVSARARPKSRHRVAGATTPGAGGHLGGFLRTDKPLPPLRSITPHIITKQTLNSASRPVQYRPSQQQQMLKQRDKRQPPTQRQYFSLLQNGKHRDRLREAEKARMEKQGQRQGVQKGEEKSKEKEHQLHYPKPDNFAARLKTKMGVDGVAVPAGSAPSASNSVPDSGALTASSASVSVAADPLSPAASPSPARALSQRTTAAAQQVKNLLLPRTAVVEIVSKIGGGRTDADSKSNPSAPSHSKSQSQTGLPWINLSSKASFPDVASIRSNPQQVPSHARSASSPSNTTSAPTTTSLSDRFAQMGAALKAMTGGTGAGSAGPELSATSSVSAAVVPALSPAPVTVLSRPTLGSHIRAQSENGTSAPAMPPATPQRSATLPLPGSVKTPSSSYSPSLGSPAPTFSTAVPAPVRSSGPVTSPTSSIALFSSSMCSELGGGSGGALTASPGPSTTPTPGPFPSPGSGSASSSNPLAKFRAITAFTHLARSMSATTKSGPATATATGTSTSTAKTIRSKLLFPISGSPFHGHSSSASGIDLANISRPIRTDCPNLAEWNRPPAPTAVAAVSAENGGKAGGIAANGGGAAGAGGNVKGPAPPRPPRPEERELMMTRMMMQAAAAAVGGTVEGCVCGGSASASASASANPSNSAVPDSILDWTQTPRATPGHTPSHSPSPSISLGKNVAPSLTPLSSPSPVLARRHASPKPKHRAATLRTMPTVVEVPSPTTPCASPLCGGGIGGGDGETQKTGVMADGRDGGAVVAFPANAQDQDQEEDERPSSPIGAHTHAQRPVQTRDQASPFPPRGSSLRARPMETSVPVQDKVLPTAPPHSHSHSYSYSYSSASLARDPSSDFSTAHSSVLSMTSSSSASSSSAFSPATHRSRAVTPDRFGGPSCTTTMFQSQSQSHSDKAPTQSKPEYQTLSMYPIPVFAPPEYHHHDRLARNREYEHEYNNNPVLPLVQDIAHPSLYFNDEYYNDEEIDRVLSLYQSFDLSQIRESSAKESQEWPKRSAGPTTTTTTTTTTKTGGLSAREECRPANAKIASPVATTIRIPKVRKAEAPKVSTPLGSTNFHPGLRSFDGLSQQEGERQGKDDTKAGAGTENSKPGTQRRQPPPVPPRPVRRRQHREITEEKEVAPAFPPTATATTTATTPVPGSAAFLKTVPGLGRFPTDSAALVALADDGDRDRDRDRDDGGDFTKTEFHAALARRFRVAESGGAQEGGGEEEEEEGARLDKVGSGGVGAVTGPVVPGPSKLARLVTVPAVVRVTSLSGSFLFGEADGSDEGGTSLLTSDAGTGSGSGSGSGSGCAAASSAFSSLSSLAESIGWIGSADEVRATIF